jgi:hypothetical protein
MPNTTTPRCFFVATDVAPWRDPRLARLDAALAAAGAVPLVLPWADFALEADGRHLAPAGFAAFADALARALPRDDDDGVVLVLADSTVDHNDRDAAWDYTGVATSRLRVALHPRRVVVDAVAGSGFVARAREGLHFRLRLADQLRRLRHGRKKRKRGAAEDAEGEEVTVVLVGGWNDLGRGLDVVLPAATACVRLATADHPPRATAS